MYRSTIVVLAAVLSCAPVTSAEADGAIVPFTSALPACAAQCGPLYDAQGACSPPVMATSDTCFCAYATLQPFLTTTAGVCDNACTTDANGLSEIRTWFLNFCGDSTSTSTTSGSGSSATATSSSSSSGSSSGSNNGWFATHWKWVVMLIVLFLAFVFGWIGAVWLHRRIIAKREKQFEMRPPVAWGPHQLQGMTGGYNHGDAAAGANGRQVAAMSGAINNEKMAASVPAAMGEKGETGKGRKWLKKNRT
ncbi:hypothetical protein BP5796_09192 [Coleophoma crateriformis]|uniref:Integral membrane protein n=1 Tax=Coleophoma crateriformis TaxID=565419 RepID=A0A3D8R3A9_9HELO|nr:hypothetical protein BP5796_09192 [Coleophoma crateriformis]